MVCAKQCLYASVVSLLLGPISALSHADQPQAVRVTEHELWQSLDLKRPGLERLKAAAAAKDREAAANAWSKYFATRTHPTCHFDRDNGLSTSAGSSPPWRKRSIGMQVVWRRAICPTRPSACPSKARRPAADRLAPQSEKRHQLRQPCGVAVVHEPTGQGLSADRRRTLCPDVSPGSSTRGSTIKRAICESQGGLGFNPIYRAYYPGIQSRILVDNYYCLAAAPR